MNEKSHNLKLIPLYQGLAQSTADMKWHKDEDWGHTIFNEPRSILLFFKYEV